MIFLQESSDIRSGVFELSDPDEKASLLAEAFGCTNHGGMILMDKAPA